MTETVLEPPLSAASKHFQILSLDGGGLRGLFSAAVLAALEEDHGIDVTRNFDLIVGTSTGGIIALALGTGLRPREIVDFYLQMGPKIFAKDRRWRRVRHVFRYKHDPYPLERALREVLGEKTLEDSRKRLVVPAFSLDSDQVYLFKTPHHPRLKRDGRVPMWQVALATSAAPTYFPAFNLEGSRLVDGGVWANNPSVVGVAEALSMLDVPLSSIRILSLGTTKPVKDRPAGLSRGGLWAWRQQAMDVVLAAQSCSTTGLAGHLVGPDNITRLDVNVPDGIFGLDCIDEERLRGLANETSRTFGPHYEQRFAPHTAAPYTPHIRQEAAA